jgi:hypothetical protein
MTMDRAAKAALDLNEGTQKNSAPVEDAGAKGGRPAIATAAIDVMIVGGFLGLGLGVYLMIWGGNLLAGFLFLLLGFAYAYGGRGLLVGESWGWGAGVFAGLFLILFGLLILPLGLLTLVPAAIVIVLLLRVREYYGMIRFDPDEEERKKDELRAARTANPEALHCPHCGATTLWIAADSSAFCDTCKTGTISIKTSA